MRIIWYTAMSMDGRVAGPGDDLSFLTTISDPQTDEWERFLAATEAVIVGASTVRWLQGQGIASPSEGRPTWLLSHSAALAAAMGPGVIRVEDAAAAVAQIRDAGYQQIWLAGGGDVAGQLLAIDAIDEVIVTVAPTALGRGPALFDNEGTSSPVFALEEVRRYGENAARLRWLRQR